MSTLDALARTVRLKSGREIATIGEGLALLNEIFPTANHPPLLAATLEDLNAAALSGEREELMLATEQLERVLYFNRML